MNGSAPWWSRASRRVWPTLANALRHSMRPGRGWRSRQNTNNGSEKNRNRIAVGTKVETRPACEVNGTAERRAAEACGDGEADHPRLAAAPRIREGAEDRNRQHDEERRDAVAKRVNLIGRSQVGDEPHREVQRRDVHREDGVREVVQCPA